MVGIGISLGVRVTGDAGERRVVRGVYVACRTSHPHRLVVRAGVDGKPGVVEGRAGPGCGGMARLAGGWECSCRVVGIGGTGVVRFVTRVAVGGGRGEVSIDVAAGARYRGMEAGQGKRGVVMVERR